MSVIPDDLPRPAVGVQSMGIVTFDDFHFPGRALYNCSGRDCNGFGMLWKLKRRLLENGTDSIQFIIMQKAITQVEQLNIGASIGIEMFAFMWISAGTAVLAWLIQLGECCCCASRRDVKKGKKRGSKKAWKDDGSRSSEKPPPRYSQADDS